MFRSKTTLYRNRHSSSGRAALPFLLFGAGWLAATIFLKQAPAVSYDSSVSQTEASEIDLTMYWGVWGILQNDYLTPDTVDRELAAYGSIKGMVESIDDPYTIFFDPGEAKDYVDSIEGTLEGIGAELMEEDGKLIVNGILKSSPAQRTGLKPKDVIYKIEDTFAAEVSISEAVKLIRGPKGTQVTLTIIREGEPEPLEIIITRESLHIDSVTWEEKENGIYVISINQFSPDTSVELDRAAADILAHDPKGLVLDVRYNPGGFMDVAVDVVSEFVTEGAAVKVASREGDETLYVDGKAKLAHLPLVVLIDGGSASAAEIVAGALQDHKRAELVGVQTYGKGTVQELRTLPKGASLKLTVAHWYTPNGRDVDRIGIHPDVVVELSEEDIAAQNDVQMTAAIESLSAFTQ